MLLVESSGMMVMTILVSSVGSVKYTLPSLSGVTSTFSTLVPLGVVPVTVTFAMFSGLTTWILSTIGAEGRLTVISGELSPAGCHPWGRSPGLMDGMGPEGFRVISSSGIKMDPMPSVNGQISVVEMPSLVDVETKWAVVVVVSDGSSERNSINSQL